MFDLTKELALGKSSHLLYLRIKTAVYSLSVILALYLACLIVFPTQYFLFSFPNPNSTQNTVIKPRNIEGVFVDHGRINADKKLFFDIALAGNYSQAQISFTLDRESQPLETAHIETRKSYQAFFYPEGDPLGFKDGTLVKNGNNYFIVSRGKLRKFAGVNIIDALGYDKDDFIGATDTDLNYNEKGDDIANPPAYPDSSIFKINDDYYILENQKLKKFVSPQAYLTQYGENQAIIKNNDFLEKYPKDENLAGFRDGTLVSYGISAYVVSSGLLFPINNTITFSAMGYDWSDVIPASGDEISMYQKDKLFTINSPHPNGTVMADEDNHFYLIKNSQKLLLSSPVIAQSWIKYDPIKVSQKSLDVKENCGLTKNMLSLRTYSCTIPLENFSGLLGKDYEFKLDTLGDIKLNSINVSFQKTASWANMKSAISGLISKIKGNYAPQNPVQ